MTDARDARRQLSRDKRLQGNHDLATNQNRVLAPVRTCTVTTYAVNDDVHTIRAHINRTLWRVNFTGGFSCTDVKRERVVWSAESSPKIIVAHHPRTKPALFGRLYNKHERSVPLINSRNHLASRSNKARNVHIMPTGMHHRYRIPGGWVYLAYL